MMYAIIEECERAMTAQMTEEECRAVLSSLKLMRENLK